MIALVALAACSAADTGRVRAGEPGGPPDRPAASVQHLTVEPRSFRREHGSCRREGVDTVAIPCVTISLDFPEVVAAATPALADSVRAFVRGATLAGGGEDTTLAADAPAMAAALVEDYEEARPYFGDYPAIWLVEREAALRCQAPRVLSLASRETRYTGGAHGLQVEHLASLDARTGRRITLADLVTDTAAVTAVAERAFREQQRIPATQSLAQAGYIFFDDERFALNDNFALCNDTLAFHYNPYEIAPYALGPTLLTLPLESIRAYLRPEWRE